MGTLHSQHNYFTHESALQKRGAETAKTAYETAVEEGDKEIINLLDKTKGIQFICLVSNE
jgi:hypothetical protein